MKTIGEKINSLRLETLHESFTQQQWAAKFQAAGLPSSGIAMSIYKGTSKYNRKKDTPLLVKTTKNRYAMPTSYIDQTPVVGMIDTIHKIQNRHSENSKWRKFEEVKKAKAKLEANGYTVC